MAGVGPQDVWNALEQSGATAVQAAGIMGNWIAESSLNPEAAAQDSNGYMSYGLAQWNTASYPGAASLVTGNPAKDLAAQVVYFFQTVPQSALTGGTPQQVAANIAQNYERCATCQQGGASNSQRQSNAAQVAGWASSGNWPASSGQASDTATLTSATAADVAKGQAQCAWSIGWGGIPDTSWLHWLSTLGGSSGNVGSGQICLLSKGQVRGALGSGILVAGGMVGLFAVSLLVNSVSQGRLAGGLEKATGNLAELAGGATAIVNPEAGAAIARGGSAVKKHGSNKQAAGTAAAQYAHRKRQAQRTERRSRASERKAQDRHDEAVAREVEGRRRDSPRGPALRDEPPF